MPRISEYGVQHIPPFDDDMRFWAVRMGDPVSGGYIEYLDLASAIGAGSATAGDKYAQSALLSSLTSGMLDNWDSAFSWGDHSDWDYAANSQVFSAGDLAGFAHASQVLSAGDASGFAHLSQVLSGGDLAGYAHASQVLSSGDLTGYAHTSQVLSSGDISALAHESTVASIGHTHTDLHSHANKITLDAIPNHSAASAGSVLTILSSGDLGWEVAAVGSGSGSGDTVTWLTSAVTLVSGGTSTSWATITCTTLPSGAKLAMLSIDTGGGDDVYQYCSLRETDSGDAGYKTGAIMANKNYHVGDFNMVGLNGSKQFDYKVDWTTTPVTIKLLGYVS